MMESPAFSQQSMVAFLVVSSVIPSPLAVMWSTSAPGMLMSSCPSGMRNSSVVSPGAVFVMMARTAFGAARASVSLRVLREISEPFGGS